MRDFPLELLPDALQRAIGAQVTMGAYPVEAVGTAALAVVSHAAQGLGNVDALYSPGVTYPTSCFFMILARSGDAKSSLYNCFMTGVHRWQERERRVFDEDMLTYAAERKIWDRQKAKAEKDENVEELLRLEKNGPKKPLSRDNIVTKATTNGLFRTLEDGWPTLGVFTGEGGSFLGGHSLKAENSPTEMASFLTTLWDGNAVDRTTGEITVRLPGRRISALVMVQPEVAERFLADPILRAHGIHARFLIVSPPAWTPPEANFIDVATAGRNSRLDAAMAEYHDTIDWMLSTEMRVSQFDERVLQPRTLCWDRDAAVHMQDWFNTTCRAWRSEGNPFFNRAFEHACRLAGALALFENETYITLPLAMAATALVEFYADQLRALDIGDGETRNSDERHIIEKLEKWFRDRAGPVSNRDLARNSPSCFRKLNGSKRDAILRSMERDEYIRAVEVTRGSSKAIMWEFKG
ncbi:DUF3987 domain-containing protein [Novosphingobium sp. 9U]|uniref:DUF3987 domain-containing protein n=1 Tax=Novosphingobium sp. 9U TaxID=2653158 RepID=UPI0012F3B4CE|nr:DUF3987 domain-containing protein [Novosphingobium sp. 9U]VWX53930.1 conserved hypothetical protein [Novosphingobium sp. 9U]